MTTHANSPPFLFFDIILDKAYTIVLLIIALPDKYSLPLIHCEGSEDYDISVIYVDFLVSDLCQLGLKQIVHYNHTGSL